MAKTKPKRDEGAPTVHVEKPVTDSKVESRPKGAGDNGNSSGTGGYHGPTTTDNNMGSERTGA